MDNRWGRFSLVKSLNDKKSVWELHFDKTKIVAKIQSDDDEEYDDSLIKGGKIRRGLHNEIVVAEILQKSEVEGKENCVMPILCQLKTPVKPFVLICPFYEGGDLLQFVYKYHDQIKRDDKLFSLIRRVAENGMNGLKFLHSNKIVHGDVKLENAIIKSGGVDQVGQIVIALCDYGFSQQLSKGVIRVDRAAFGSPKYIAPELLSEKKVSQKIDIFSFGVLMYMLYYKKAPLESERVDPVTTSKNIKKAIESDRRHAIRAGQQKVFELIPKMTSLSPEDRPDAEESLRILNS